MKWYLKVLRQYADFSGRARRKEYWMFMLFNFLIIAFVIPLLLRIIFTLTEMSQTLDTTGMTVWLILLGIYSLAVLIPSLAVTVRRWHDIGKSGWWLLWGLLIGLIPLIGLIWLPGMMATEGQPTDNRYGPNPKTEDERESRIGLWFFVGFLILCICFIFTLPTILRKAHDPENTVGYATDKWGDEMKRSVVDYVPDKHNWNGIMTKLEHDNSIRLLGDEKFILYNFRRRKFEKLDIGSGYEKYQHSAEKPEDISIIVVYGIGTNKVGQIRTTSRRGTHYSDAEEDYVKIELIDVKTWKVFATHSSGSNERASVKNPKVILTDPTLESVDFINKIINSRNIR